MSLLYDVDAQVEEIVKGVDGHAGLGPDRGAYRQEGSTSHLFQGVDDAEHRVGKVSARVIAGMTPRAIADALRRQIDEGCVIDGRDYGCASHLVAVDEIGNTFNDGKPPKAPRRNFRSRRAARAAGLPPPVPLPPVNPRSAGARLSAAMRMLEVPSPYGGTYASRVHFYLAPALTSSIAAGLGPNHNLGRDGKPHFSTWRGVMPALARAGGVWLEMFHAETGARTAFTAAEWRKGPTDFLDLFARAGGGAGRMHFLLTRVPAAPAGAPAGCGDPMSCQWRMADLPGVNAQVTANGVGAYRVEEQAAAWLREHNARVG
jgi:hypothetical protein